MNQYAIESFISFCDDMMIVEEGISISSIKNFLKKIILRILYKAEFYVKKLKNPSIKNFLLRAIAKLKHLLGETDKIDNENCNEKYDAILNETKKIEKEIDEKVGDDDKEEYEKIEEIRYNGEVNDPNRPFNVIKKVASGKSSYYYQICYNSDEFISEVYSELLAADRSKTFSEYIPHFKKFKKLIGLPEKCIVYGINIHKSQKSLNLYFIPENNRLVKRNINKPLYHTSSNPNLKSLDPHWRAERDNDCTDEEERFVVMSGRYFDTPRVYFGVVPVSRMGNPIQSNSSSNISIYKVDGIKQAYIDVDGIKYGRAVYVESNSPIPVTKVDYFNDKK